MTAILQEIHSVFIALAKQPELKYQPCERMLYDFHKLEFTADDLRCVLTFMTWQNSKREPKYRDKLQFHRIVGDLEIFNSRLGEARAWERNVKKNATEREKILEATGREATPPTKERPISDIAGKLISALKKAVK